MSRQSRQSSLLESNSNIPLHCNVCPRKPNFSDVSHLLTHVASKGHLSAYYRLKLSNKQDDKDAIEEYDEWYSLWSVQDLMKERMEQKERKKSGGGSGARTNAASASTSRRSSAGELTASIQTPFFPIVDVKFSSQPLGCFHHSQHSSAITPCQPALPVVA
jgi:hypothetical protein